MNRHIQISLGISTIIAILYIVFVDAYSFAWCDEIYFSNPAVNYLHGGDWYTEGIGNLYPPLYSLLLTAWFYAFGVSHLAAVSLEIVITLVVYFKLVSIIHRRVLFENTISYYILLPLFWVGFYMPTIFTMGRVDMLVLLLLLFLIDIMMPCGDKLEIEWWRIVIVSALLSFSAIYPLPFICFILLFSFVKNKKNRKQLFRGGVYMMIGFSVGILFTLLFAYSNKFLAGFLAWILGTGYSGRASFGEKLLHAYCDLPTIILYCGSLVLMKVRNQKKIPGSLLGFIIAIPLLMTLAGRYERYYWWMTSIPVIIFFISTIETLPRKVVLTILFVTTIICFTSQIYIIQYPHRYSHDYLSMNYSKNIEDYKHEQDLAKKIVNDNMTLIKEYKNVVFLSESLYYPLLEKDVSCWYNFHDVHFALHDRTKIYWRVYEDYIRAREERESFPGRGVFFALNNEQAKNGKVFLEKKKYTIKEYGVELCRDAVVFSFEK